jgi:hypothetical protein
MSITPPPPVAEPSWSSLVWRIWRLSSKVVRLPRVTRCDPTGKADLLLHLLSPEDTESITMEAIKDSIDRCKEYFKYPAWPKYTTDESEFRIVLQRLAHIQGRNRMLWKQVPTTTADLYAAAADCLFDYEATRYSFMPPGWRNNLQSNGRKTKGCCGCCACHCHSKSVEKRVPSGVRIYGMPKKRFSFHWLKKLMFWRRDRGNDRDDRSSTISTTLAD